MYVCVVAWKWTFVEIVIKFRIFCCKSQSHKENENPLKTEKKTTYIYTNLYVFFGDLFYYLLCRFYSLVERDEENRTGGRKWNGQYHSKFKWCCLLFLQQKHLNFIVISPVIEHCVCWGIYIKFKMCDWKMPGLSLALSVSHVDIRQTWIIYLKMFNS